MKESVPNTGEAARPKEQAPGAAADWYSLRHRAKRVRQGSAQEPPAAPAPATGDALVEGAGAEEPPQHAPDDSCSR